MLWNLLTAGIFGTDYYIKKKINTSEKKDLKEKCLGGRLIVRNCHNHGMMLGILKNKDKNLFINPVFKEVRYKEDLNTQIEKYIGHKNTF